MPSEAYLEYDGDDFWEFILLYIQGKIPLFQWHFVAENPQIYPYKIATTRFFTLSIAPQTEWLLSHKGKSAGKKQTIKPIAFQPHVLNWLDRLLLPTSLRFQRHWFSYFYYVVFKDHLLRATTQNPTKTIFEQKGKLSNGWTLTHTRPTIALWIDCLEKGK